MELLGSQQVEAQTGIPVNTLRYWRTRKEGPPSFKIGRRVVYRADLLQQWLLEQEAKCE